MGQNIITYTLEGHFIIGEKVKCYSIIGQTVIMLVKFITFVSSCVLSGERSGGDFLYKYVDLKYLITYPT